MQPCGVMGGFGEARQHRQQQHGGECASKERTVRMNLKGEIAGEGELWDSATASPARARRRTRRRSRPADQISGVDDGVMQGQGDMGQSHW